VTGSEERSEQTVSAPGAPRVTPLQAAALGVPAVLYGLAAPWSIAASQISLGIGLLGVITALFTGWRPPRPWPRLLIWIGLLILLQALSIPLGVHPLRSWRAFPHSAWVYLLPLLYWCLLADARWRRRALLALVVSGALAGAYGIAQHYTTAVWPADRTAELLPGGGYIAIGTLGHHLTYAGVLLPIFFAAFGLALNGRKRAALLLVAALIAGGLLFSAARTAWIGLVAGSLLLGWIHGRRYFLAALGGLVLVGVVVLVLDPGVRARFFTLAGLTEVPRIRLWLTALHIAADHTWIGTGLASWREMFAVYRVPGEYMSTSHPHNDLLLVLVETGVLGVAAWIGIWVAFFRETRTASRLANALRAGVAAMLVAGLGQCFATDEEVAQVWWFIVTAALLTARRSLDGSSARPRTGRP